MNRTERLALLDRHAEPVIRQALFVCGALSYISWDQTAPKERRLNVAIYFDALGDARWDDFVQQLAAARSAQAPSSAQLTPLPPVPPGPFKLSGLPSVSARLIGRKKELALLDQAWESERPFIVGVIGEGGQGKSVLLHTWLRDFRRDHLRGAGCVLVHSFYGQGMGKGASSGLFFSEAFEVLGLPGAQSDLPQEKAIKLAKALRRQKSLLILDGLEPLQEATDGPAKLDDLGLKCLLRELAQGFSGLCVLSSRQPLRDLELHQQDGDYHEIHVESVTPVQRAEILVGAGVSAGTAAEAVSARLPHSLSTRLLGKAIQAFLSGDAAGAKTWFPGQAGISPDEVLAVLDERLSESQRKVMWIMGLFDRPAPRASIFAVCRTPAIPGLTENFTEWTASDWESMATSLRNLDLLWQEASEDPSDCYDVHPLIREYFARQFRDRQPEAFRAAHARLFEHLCATTEHRPDTLPGLQPLYQAVTHGCLAGRQQEAVEKVYADRILRGGGSDGFYSTKKLGAVGADLGAVAAFFDEPWTRLSPNLSAPAQAWLLNEAASRLRALGRLTEAVEPMRENLNMRVKAEEWQHAPSSASNLSELEVALGRLRAAVDDGRRAIEFADRSGNVFLRMVTRTTAADALHQAGERAEAGALFAEAERMQAKSQPQFPLLYSLQGFQYADLLLAPAERAAWRKMQESGVRSQESEVSAPLAACAEAERRAVATIKRRTGLPTYSLLDIALDHLTQARAALYLVLLSPKGDGERALLTRDSSFILHPSTFSDALTKLRATNDLDMLPRALLTAAHYHGTLGGDAAEAARLLDEAQQIAERGPMPLHLADVHLHRARLFRDQSELAKARALIEKYGYARRREELEDASKRGSQATE
jgi:tetratricopeptide (TPR) repeat protein